MSQEYSFGIAQLAKSGCSSGLGPGVMIQSCRCRERFSVSRIWVGSSQVYEEAAILQVAQRSCVMQSWRFTSVLSRVMF